MSGTSTMELTYTKVGDYLIPDLALDGAANLIQEVHGHFAGGVAQVVKDSRGGKLGDTGEIAVLQIVGWIQTTADEDSILDAGGQ